MQTQAMPITPVNPVTGNEYSGKNILRLLDAMDNDPRFVTGGFATFRQWLTVGRCVRKGEKGAARLVTYGKAGEAQESAQPVAARGSFVKGFTVFALEQTEALPASDAPPAGSVAEWSDSMAQENAAHDRGTVDDAPVAPKSHPKPLATDKVQDKAERLLAAAESCFADRLQNTPKRLAQAMHKRMEGQRMERAAHILKAYLHATDGGVDPLPGVTHTQLITWAQEAAVYNAKPVSNGYHGYHVETTEAKHNEPHHVTLRALLDPRACAASAEKIAKEQAEAELRNIDAPGFFPTPPAVIRAMLEYAGNLTGMHVLEPSAGKGDLVRAAFNAGAKSVRSFEIIPSLANYLHEFVRTTGSQVHTTQNANFLEVSVPPALFDAVLMNPPFEKNAAPAHVLRALSWLKPGGRLVAVMPSGWIEKPSADALLKHIDAAGLSYEEVEVMAGSFSGADAFRQTGVNVQLLVIH